MANAGVTLSDGVAGRRSGRHTDGLGSLHVLDQLIIAGRVKPGHRALRQEAPLADRVSAVLAVLYVTDVVGLQTAFDAVSPAARNTLATAGLTLLVAALFRPVRSRFEAVRAIETFAAQVRGEAEVAAILDDLVAVAALTVLPSASDAGCARLPDGRGGHVAGHGKRPLRGPAPDAAPSLEDVEPRARSTNEDPRRASRVFGPTLIVGVDAYAPPASRAQCSNAG